jgi:hypothetical protein
MLAFAITTGLLPSLVYLAVVARESAAMDPFMEMISDALAAM